MNSSRWAFNINCEFSITKNITSFWNSYKYCGLETWFLLQKVTFPHSLKAILKSNHPLLCILLNSPESLGPRWDLSTAEKCNGVQWFSDHSSSLIMNQFRVICFRWRWWSGFRSCHVGSAVTSMKTRHVMFLTMWVYARDKLSFEVDECSVWLFNNGRALQLP
jgi:hypothetical protein